MKRFFILASAAIVALASCAKTQVVYNDAPEEIALKTVNMPMTKTGTAYTQDLGVAAYKLDGTPYFSVTKFTKDGIVWTGGQYWPLSTPLAFVAYGPYTNGAESVVVNTTGITATGVKSDVDFVYSGYVNNSGAGFGKGNNVPMTLYHTKAKIVVNVNVVGGNEIVKKIELLEAPDGGNCTVTFPNTVVWAGEGTKTFEFAAAPDNVHYVVPGTPTTLKITYDSKVPDQKGLETEVVLSTKTMYNEKGDVVSGWQAGYSYIYNVIIESALITIEATEEPWIELSDVDPNE